MAAWAAQHHLDPVGGRRDGADAHSDLSPSQCRLAVQAEDGVDPVEATGGDDMAGPTRRLFLGRLGRSAEQGQTLARRGWSSRPVAERRGPFRLPRTIVV